MEEINLKKWFMIWGHSSGLVYDKSELKNVFNGLETLKIWDRVKLVRSDWLVIEYVIKNTSIKELSEKITLSNKYYIYTCYPTWSNKKRLVVELDEIKSK
jgi:sortase (surface protein transpeptidase)